MKLILTESELRCLIEQEVIKEMGWFSRAEDPGIPHAKETVGRIIKRVNEITKAFAASGNQDMSLLDEMRRIVDRELERLGLDLGISNLADTWKIKVPPETKTEGIILESLKTYLMTTLMSQHKEKVWSALAPLFGSVGIHEGKDHFKADDIRGELSQVIKQGWELANSPDHTAKLGMLLNILRKIDAGYRILRILQTDAPQISEKFLSLINSGETSYADAYADAIAFEASQ